jgi:hypothetical protein
MGTETVDADLTAIYADIDSAIDEAGEVAPEVEDTPEPDAQPDADAEVAPEVETPVVDADPEVTKARDNGWRPKEEYKGEPGEWVDAAEYNRRQPLYDRLGKQNKELKGLKKTLDAVVKYQKEQESKIREKVIAELEGKKREAVKYADTDAFEAAETELKKLQDEKGLEVEEEEAPAAPEQPEIPTFVQ